MYAHSGCVAARWLCVFELVCVCVSLVRVVIICLASTHTALVSQSVVGRTVCVCFAFPSIFVYVEVMWSLAARRAAGRT